MSDINSVDRRVMQCRLALWLAVLLFAFVFFRNVYPLAWQTAAFGAFCALLWPFVRGRTKEAASVVEDTADGYATDNALDADEDTTRGGSLSARVEVGLDLLVATALVNVSGGFSSPFAPVGFVVIVEAFALLGAPEAIYTALFAAVLNLVHFRLGVTARSAAVYGVATGTLLTSALMVSLHRGLRQGSGSLFGPKPDVSQKTRALETLQQERDELDAANRQLRENYREVTHLHREQKNLLTHLRASEQLFQASLQEEEPQAGYPRLLRAMMELVDAGGAVLWTRPRGTEQFQVQATEGRVAPNFDSEPIVSIGSLMPGELRALCEARLVVASPKATRLRSANADAPHEDELHAPDRPVAVMLLRDARLDYAAPGSLIGAIGLCDARPSGNFAPADLDKLASLAAPFAIALDNVEQRVQAQRRVREVSLLYDLSRLVQSATDMEQIYQAVVMQVQQVVPCENCTLFLLDKSRTRLEARATRGRVVNLLDHIGFARGAGVSGWVAARGLPLNIPDLTHEPNLLNVEMIPPRVRSFIAMPLRVQDNVVGVINVSHARPHAFTQDDVRLLTILASQAAITIERTEVFHTLETLAITDGLTQTYNRRYFQMRLEDEMRRSHRYDQPLSLLIVDADKFKSINDQHGHATGDLVLQELARVLKQSVRETEIVARYGGEEFAIILPQTTEAESVAAGERVRASIESHPFRTVEGLPLRLTISVGVADAPRRATTAPALIEEADRALLIAKRGGRNRVCSVSSSLQSGRSPEKIAV